MSEVNKLNQVSKRPILRINESTGEKVAGFLNIDSGEFEEIMTIHDERDLDTFLVMFELSVVLISKYKGE